MGLQKKKNDPVFQVHKAYYLVAGSTSDLMLLENVTEYDEIGTIEEFLGKKWGVASARVDPRNFGYGASRPRMYAICWNKEKLQWSKNPALSLESLLNLLLARPRMAARDFFWQDLPKSKLTASEEARLH